MLRILRSTFTIPVGLAQAADATIDQTNLEAAIPIGSSFLPLGLAFDPEDPNVLVKSLTLKNTKTDENALALIPAGDGVSIEAVNKLVAVKAGGISANEMTVAHGVKLSGVFDNGGIVPAVVQVLWKVMA